MACDVLSARVVHMQCGQRSPVSITGDSPHPVKFFNVVRQACGGYVVKLQGLSTYPRRARQSQAWVTGKPGKARLSTPSRCGQASYPCGATGGAVALRRPRARRGATKGAGLLIGLLRLRPRRASAGHDDSEGKQGFPQELAGTVRATGQGLSSPSLHTGCVSAGHDDSEGKQGFPQELAGTVRATGQGLSSPSLHTGCASAGHDDSEGKQGFPQELAGTVRATGQGLSFPPLRCACVSEGRVDSWGRYDT